MPFSMTELGIDELQVRTSRQLPDDIGKNIPQQVDLAIFKANVCDARVSFDAITQPKIVGGKSKPSKLEDGALKPHQPWKRLLPKVARPKRRLSQDFVHHAQPTANGALPNSKDGGSGRPNQGFMEDPARQRTSPYKPPSVVNSDKNTEPGKPRSAPSLKGVTNDEQAEPASRSSAVQTSVVANQMPSLESVGKSPAILSVDAQSSQLSRVGTKSSAVQVLAVPSLGDVATDNTDLPSIEMEPIGKGSGEASTELEAHLKRADKGKGREETHDRPKIPVEIPLSPRERVRNFSFKSSRFLQAEETDTSMSENEINQLGRFARLLNGAKSQKVLFGKPLPELSIRLVLINDGIEPAKKFICVTGLVEKAEISNFHTIVSQKRYRESYSDLWLCYETTKVSRASGSLETYRLYPLDMDKPSTPDSLSTFCGVASEMTAASRNTSANVSWLSTLGGLICIDNNYYIITTAHRPEQNPGTSTNDVEQSSPADTLVDEDFPDDVKPALIMVPEHLLQDPTNCFGNSELPAQLHSHLETRKHLDFSPNGDVIEGPDWRLLPVNQSEILPNRLKRKPTSSQLDNEWVYIQSISNTTSGRQVLINSGISGLVKGSVYRYPSFLIGDYSTPPEVWRVTLHDSAQLQRGDSGSWVIDEGEMELMGTVTAISHSVAYFVKILQPFWEIDRKLRPKTGLRIPSALRVLLDKAFALHSQDQTRQAQEVLSELFSADFLSQLPRSLPGGRKVEMALRELLMSRDSNAARPPQIQAVLKPLITRHTVAQWDDIIGNFDAWWVLQANNLAVAPGDLTRPALEDREVYRAIVDAYQESKANFKQDVLSRLKTGGALEIMPMRQEKSRPGPGGSSHAGMSEKLKAGPGPDPEIDHILPATAPKKMPKKLGLLQILGCCSFFSNEDSDAIRVFKVPRPEAASLPQENRPVAKKNMPVTKKKQPMATASTPPISQLPRQPPPYIQTKPSSSSSRLGLATSPSRSELDTRGRSETIQEARRKFQEKELAKEEKLAREEIRALEKRNQMEARQIERGLRSFTN